MEEISINEIKELTIEELQERLSDEQKSIIEKSKYTYTDLLEEIKLMCALFEKVNVAHIIEDIAEYGATKTELLYNIKPQERATITNKVTNMEELAKLLIKCSILDNRVKKFNSSKLDFEELVYEKMMDLKEYFGENFLFLIEYSLYFQQRQPNRKMLQEIKEGISFMIYIIKTTKEERRKFKYDSVIENLKICEKDYYNSLENMTDKEKDEYIKESLINDLGETLYRCEYYILTHNRADEKSKLYSKIVRRLLNIVNAKGRQKEIKEDEKIQKRITEKNKKRLNEMIEEKRKNQ